jgi:hypothetical protein
LIALREPGLRGAVVGLGLVSSELGVEALLVVRVRGLELALLLRELRGKPFVLSLARGLLFADARELRSTPAEVRGETRCGGDATSPRRSRDAGRYS